MVCSPGVWKWNCFKLYLGRVSCETGFRRHHLHFSPNKNICSLPFHHHFNGRSKVFELSGCDAGKIEDDSSRLNQSGRVGVDIDGGLFIAGGAE